MTAPVQALFAPFRLGNLELPTRVVMAPMTRSFSPGGVPTEEVCYAGQPHGFERAPSAVSNWLEAVANASFSAAGVSAWFTRTLTAFQPKPMALV